MARPLGFLVMVIVLLALVPVSVPSAETATHAVSFLGPVPLRASPAAGPGVPAAVSWPTYLFNPERTGANPAERTIAPSNVSKLQELWTLPENGSDFSAPIVVNNTLYYGSWNGYEYAVNVSTGYVDWSIYLGTDPGCGGYQPMGISSTPAYLNGTLYLGGGDGYWYALNAVTGQVEWSFYVGALPAVNNYDWASALTYRNSLYIGVSSCFDNPLIRGALIEVNLSGSHTANHTFYAVPEGQTGDSIWTTPALDPGNNTIWISTGNENSSYPPYANAIVALDATNLSVLGSWQVPNVAGQDSDFGSTPTLFHTTSGIPMVVATNKDNIAYALNRSNVSTSGSWAPAWTLDTGGGFSSGAFYNDTLYLAGNGLYAVNPNNGSVEWENTAVTGVYAALTWANGIVYVGSGATIYAIDAVNGTTLWTSNVPGGGSIVEEAVVDDGRLYVSSGNYGTEGNLTAYGLPFNASASASPTHGIADLNVDFRGRATGGLTPYYFTWDFGDGSFGFTANPIHSYTVGGNFTVTVWINDSAGGSIEQSFEVGVVPALVSPISQTYLNVTYTCGGPPTSGARPMLVRLSTSTTGGNSPYTYRWSFSNGGVANASTVSRPYSAPFTANLTVTDSAGHTLNQSVLVAAPGANAACPPRISPWLVWGHLIGYSAAAILAVLVGVLLWRRRRQPEPPSPPTAGSVPPSP